MSGWFTAKEIIRFIDGLKEDGARITMGRYDGTQIQEDPYYPENYAEYIRARHAHVYGRTPEEERFNVEFINYLQRESGPAYLIMNIHSSEMYKSRIIDIWKEARGRE